MKNTFLGFYKIRELSELIDSNAVLLFGVPFERLKATLGGSKKAPKTIRKQSLEFSGVSLTFDVTKSKRNFFDLGDIHPINEREKLKAIWEKAEELNSEILVLGGDHSITYDTLSVAPWDEKTGLIWLDAHADLADEYPPGIFQSHGTVFTNLKNQRNLRADQLLLIGGHSYTQMSAEHEKIRNKEVNFIPIRKIHEEKSNSMELISNFLDNFDRIYMSIDLDVIDQAFVPTLATAEPFGLTPAVLQEILRVILPKTKYVDIVEARHYRNNRIVPNLVVGLIFYILEIWDLN
ncbi:MAG: arginase family protein [Candidatus Heimdallarchaeota archaeon]|nr:arginase family protein [Candidatus Heimdallarchaeota archaeon]MCK4954959.1 arginase family protein [Candidatus Heimdallarchaeota archaeon]